MDRKDGSTSTQSNATFGTPDAEFTIYVESFAKLRMQSLDLKTRIEEARKRHGIALGHNSKGARQTGGATGGNHEERA